MTIVGKSANSLGKERILMGDLEKIEEVMQIIEEGRTEEQGKITMETEEQDSREMAIGITISEMATRKKINMAGIHI